jgi:nicotinamidase-related amidase
MIVLVIVDMQISYKAAQDAELIARIERYARRVKKQGGHVVEIAMDGSGHATYSLPFEVPCVMKDQTDGGSILYAYLLGAVPLKDDLRVEFCGVNFSACVYETAKTLADRLSTERALCDHVTIRTDLCGDGERFRVRFATA